jgi:prepilin peptidase CpaA
MFARFLGVGRAFAKRTDARVLRSIPLAGGKRSGNEPSNHVHTGHLYIFPLLALLTWAAAMDVRARRIPNWLTLSLALSGLMLSITGLGAVTAQKSLLGLVIGLGIGLVMFIVGAWGAGDAKLLAGIGAWLGAVAVVWVTLGAAIIGLVAVLICGVAQGRLGSIVQGGFLLGCELSCGTRVGASLHRAEALPQIKARTLPLAVPIVLATAGLLLVNLIRGSIA